jgi:hypothetical protein
MNLQIYFFILQDLCDPVRVDHHVILVISAIDLNC